MVKPLRPSLKERKRYVVYEIYSEQPLGTQEIVQTIEQKLHEFLGVLGMAKAGVMILAKDIVGNKGIIRVGHKYVDDVKMALSLITTIDNTKVIVTPRGVSGILKKARERYIPGHYKPPKRKKVVKKATQKKS